MMIKILPVLLTALFLLGGCGHTPLREIHPAALPPHPAEDAVTQARAKQLSNVMAPLKIRGAVIFPAAVFGRFETDTVLKALAQCNFNRIYCHITSERELNETLQHFIIAAKERNFAVEIVISQQDFYRQYQVNQVIRPLMVQFPTLTDAARLVAEFNQELPETARLDGITVHITPHLYNGTNVRRMYGSIYRWSEKSYGAGEDNDMLMRKTFAGLKNIAAIEKLPPLTVAMADFLHDRAKKGDLTVGTVKDIAAIAPQIAMVNTANLPSQLAANITAELADAPAKSQVLAVVPLATHTSINSDRLRRRNWNDFIRAVENLIAAAGKSPACGGVILSPYSVVEYLRLEK
ncbi:MAG: hypothetical protein E7041_03400 [Lentisphaerae bacterium]|nr:hypothetical protein [Lentisphaerota bacterium]